MKTTNQMETEPTAGAMRAAIAIHELRSPTISIAQIIDRETGVAELAEKLKHMTDIYAKAMKDAGVSYYPEALFEVREARAALAKAKGAQP